MLNKRPVQYPLHLRLGENDYSLFSVIEHLQLNPMSGHYIAYKRLFPGGSTGHYKSRWIQANDGSISIVSQQEVLARQQGAYMLFYQRD